MKKNILSLFIQHKEIRMTSTEKKFTWEAISARTIGLENVSVRKPILSRLYYVGLLPVISQQRIFSRKKKYALGAILGTLIVSGGVSAFAQDALPGEMLYTVKTNVNEKLQVAVAFTPQAKADVEATLATRRLEEVEGLVLKGKLSSSLEKETNESFDAHVDKFDTHIAELEKRSEFVDVAKVGVFFQTRIAVHAAVLKDMGINNQILSSAKTTTKNEEENIDSHLVAKLGEKILSATVPTIIATKKALVKISPTTSNVVDIHKNNRGQSNNSLDIDSQEAKDYLEKLHQDLGTPSPVMRITPIPNVSVFVPQN